MKKNNSAQKGSMTVEAVFIMIIILAVIFLLLYFCFYSMDGVKMKCMFLYQIMNAQEENEREENKEADIKRTLQEEFEPGIIARKMECVDTEKKIRTIRYQLSVKIISAYPLVRKIFNWEDGGRMRVSACFNRTDGCEIVRMYQAFTVSK